MPEIVVAESTKIFKTTCDNCGKTFNKRISRYQGKNTYCSRECYFASNKVGSPKKIKNKEQKERKRFPAKEYICAQCGTKFKRSSKAVKDINKLFCSQECWNIFRKKTRIKPVCQVCEREFNGPLRKKYCSKKCQQSTYKKDKTIADLRNSEEYKEFRENVQRRDNWSCRECLEEGKEIHDQLIVHHIIPIYVDISKIFKVENGITLCRKCHNKTINYEAQYSDFYFSLLKIDIGPYVCKQWYRDINPYQIIRKRELGYTQEEIARHFEVCRTTIYKRMNEEFPSTEIRRIKGKTYYSIFKMFENGNTITNIAKLEHSTIKNITNIIRLWIKKPTPIAYERRSKLGLTGNVLRKLHKEKGFSAVQIAEMFKTEPRFINKLLLFYKIERNKLKQWNKRKKIKYTEDRKLNLSNSLKTTFANKTSEYYVERGKKIWETRRCQNL